MRRLLWMMLTAASLHAQGLDPQKLLTPPVDTWPTYNGDYSGQIDGPGRPVPAPAKEPQPDGVLFMMGGKWSSPTIGFVMAIPGKSGGPMLR